MLKKKMPYLELWIQTPANMSVFCLPVDVSKSQTLIKYLIRALHYLVSHVYLITQGKYGYARDGFNKL